MNVLIVLIYKNIMNITRKFCSLIDDMYSFICLDIVNSNNICQKQETKLTSFFFKPTIFYIDIFAKSNLK